MEYDIPKNSLEESSKPTELQGGVPCLDQGRWNTGSSIWTATIAVYENRIALCKLDLHAIHGVHVVDMGILDGIRTISFTPNLVGLCTFLRSF